jgi:hypothetical protein
MRRCRVLLLFVLLLSAILVSRPSRLRGADDAKKAPDALQTAEAFLNLAVNGQAKEAAELGEPDKSPSRERSVRKHFGDLDVKKPPRIVSFHADEDYALAITEVVATKNKKQSGPLSLRLVKKDNRWMIRDIDLGEKQASQNLERLKKEHPKAKVVIPKKDK